MEAMPRLLSRRALSSLACGSCVRKPTDAAVPERALIEAKARKFHASTNRHADDDHQPAQAQPLGGYYADLLSQPTTQPPASSSASPSTKKANEETARVLFGSRLAGSGYERVSRTPDATWRTVNGVPIPPRPAEPDNCCMSGCVHCVWDDYRDEIEDWAVRSKEAQAKAQGSGMVKGAPKVNMGRREVQEASVSMDDDGGGSETNWSTGLGSSDSEDLFATIPVGIREFMRTEKRLRDTHQHGKGSRAASE